MCRIDVPRGKKLSETGHLNGRGALISWGGGHDDLNLALQGGTGRKRSERREETELPSTRM